MEQVQSPVKLATEKKSAATTQWTIPFIPVTHNNSVVEVLSLSVASFTADLVKTWTQDCYYSAMTRDKKERNFHRVATTTLQVLSNQLY